MILCPHISLFLQKLVLGFGFGFLKKLDSNSITLIHYPAFLHRIKSKRFYPRNILTFVSLSACAKRDGSKLGILLFKTTSIPHWFTVTMFISFCRIATHTLSGDNQFNPKDANTNMLFPNTCTCSQAEKLTFKSSKLNTVSHNSSFPFVTPTYKAPL